MIVLQDRNVNGLYSQALATLETSGIQQESRNGSVVTVPSPVVSVYQRPQERVLFDAKRDANPFFHFFEALWMLQGRDDPQYLDQFVHDFSARFAEPAGHLHGAYGQRWRHWYGMGRPWDQLPVIINRLRKDPNDRRVVLTMWNPDYDLIDDERLVGPVPKDLPCNTHAYPRIIDGHLDLTILCRSNDVIWGAYGANAVHFSFLQEYLAAHIGVQVGRLYQVSNNWHAYKNILDKIGWPHDTHRPAIDPYENEEVYPYPLVSNPDQWDNDLGEFMANPTSAATIYYNDFFPSVAVPLARAHDAYRNGHYQIAINYALSCAATDWSLAATQWLDRKQAKANATVSA